MPNVQEQVQTLETLERPELVARWVKAYGTLPFNLLNLFPYMVCSKGRIYPSPMQYAVII